MSRHWRDGRHEPRRLEVQPHASGPWVLRAGRRVLAVPPGIGRALLPLHGGHVSAAAAERALCRAGGTARGHPVVAWLVAADRPGDPARRAPLLRLPLLPASVVRVLACGLAPLAGTAGLAFTAAAGLAAVACVQPWSQPGALTPAALLLFAIGAMGHELGHAAALRREGYAPGPIGIGLFVVVPVLYADVSAVRLLGRGGRLRVDLAGPAFQAGAAGALAVVGAAGGVPGPVAAAARTAAVASLAAIAWALLPLPRSDGAWACRDAFGERGRAAAVLMFARHVTALVACWLLPARLVALIAAAAAAAGLEVAVSSRRLAVPVLTALMLGVWLAAVLSRLGRSARLRYHGARDRPLEAAGNAGNAVVVGEPGSH